MNYARSFLLTITLATSLVVSLAAMNGQLEQQQPNINDLRFTLACQDGTLIEGISYQALMLGKCFQVLFSDLGDAVYKSTSIPIAMYGDCAIIRDMADYCECIAALQQEGKSEDEILSAVCRRLKNINTQNYKGLLERAKYYDFLILVRALEVSKRVQDMNDDIVSSQLAGVPENEIIQGLCNRFRPHPKLEALLEDAYFYQLPLAVKAVELLIKQRDAARNRAAMYIVRRYQSTRDKA